MQRITLLILYLLFIIPSVTAAQLVSDVPDTARVYIKKPNWDVNLRAGVNGSQASYRNWTQGGVNNVTASGHTTGTAEYTKGKYRLNSRLNLRYGQTWLEGNELRKSEDIFRFRNQLTRQFDDKRFGTVINVNFETQFDKGYDADRENVVSRFMAPAYLTETIGFSFSPLNTKFEMDTGIAMKQTYVRDTALSTRYGLDEGQRFQNEAGFSMIFKYEVDLMENVTYVGYLETFSNVLKKLESTDFTFTNELRGRINRYLRANIEFAVQYNDNVSKELQIKQLLSLGLNYQIF